MNKKINKVAICAIILIVAAFCTLFGILHCAHNKDLMPENSFFQETMSASEEDVTENSIKADEEESESLGEVALSEEGTKFLEEETQKDEEKEQADDKALDDEPSEEMSSDLEEKLFCTLSVRCDSVLKNIEKLAQGKIDIIPADGIIFPEQKVIFSEGESVFDVLLREMKDRQIHLEFVDTPMYNSAYIEGIGNLYEFDCGVSSGWQYRVNGVKPTYGCSQHKLKKGDKVEFFYSCNIFGEEN